MLHLVLEDRLGVVQQPADERRLTVVDRAGGGDPQELGGPRRGLEWVDGVRLGVRRGAARRPERSVVGLQRGHV